MTPRSSDGYCSSKVRFALLTNDWLRSDQRYARRGPGLRQSRGKSGSAACCAESLWFSGADSLPSSPRLGWKAQPSSRPEGVSQGGSPRKGEAFPQSRRQSRFGILPFGDFDAILATKSPGNPDSRLLVQAIVPSTSGEPESLGRSTRLGTAHCPRVPRRWSIISRKDSRKIFGLSGLRNSLETTQDSNHNATIGRNPRRISPQRPRRRDAGKDCGSTNKEP